MTMPLLSRFGLCLLLLPLTRVAANWSCAGAAPEVLTPQRVADLRQVTAVATAPDGSRVAYVLSVPRQPGVEPDGEPWTELWVADGSEGGPRPYVTGKVNVESVRWTADSRRIAFLAKRGEEKTNSVYLIPIDGGEARRAAGLASDISTFSLAPDGKRIALVASEPEPEARKKLQDKGFKQEIYEEEMRPAKIWIASLFDPDSHPVPLALTGSVFQVHWSPVDDRLLVALAPTPLVDQSMMDQRVRIVSAKTGDILAGFENGGKLTQLAWSLDGRRIACVAAADVHDPAAGRLLVADAAGGPLRDVLPALLGHVTQVAWSKNDEVTYIAEMGVETILGRVRVSGSEPKDTVLSGLGQRVLTGLSLSKDGQYRALIAHAPRHPPELFTMSSSDGGLKRRTESNPALAKIRWARQEVVRHKARDGLQLEGVLVRPLDEEPGRRYPLILAVHGGPESHVSHGWVTSYSMPGQVGAARGMAVFYPNYRGSTGRGVAFSRLGQGDAAGKEFDDLIDAVDYLVASGLVDRAKVGVTGGSYGGYATAWCSTRFSDRFAAGVMFVGISDKVSKVGTTDIPNEEYYVHALKRPWEDWQFLLERSPIYYAGNARTPLLILHGKDDPRVNPGQSRELYRHLKLRGQAPVRLVLYPGEGHGNKKAAARLDYNLRMMAWLEHYLQGKGGAMPPSELDYKEPGDNNESIKP
jgi:dipeptidyl aminopeptidase/acylaminoacyl peptidase